MIVTELDYPFGLRCFTCDVLLPPGAEYQEVSLGGDWVTAKCLRCAGENQ